MTNFAWTATYGEVKSAAEWTELGDNDRALQDGSGIDDDAIKSRHIDWADTGSGDNGGIWWEEIGRTTLGASNDTITVSSFATRKYIRILFFAFDTGGTIRPAWTFNGDTGSNYAITISENGGADGSSVSQTSFLTTGAASASPCITIIDIPGNTASDEKVGWVRGGFAGAAGGGNAPGNRREGVVKWANTAAAITTVAAANTGTGDFASGSEIIVLGHN